jgi:hypothetical protein
MILEGSETSSAGSPVAVTQAPCTGVARGDGDFFQEERKRLEERTSGGKDEQDRVQGEK